MSTARVYFTILFVDGNVKALKLGVEAYSLLHEMTLIKRVQTSKAKAISFSGTVWEKAKQARL